jgi:phosphoglycerol transferase
LAGRAIFSVSARKTIAGYAVAVLLCTSFLTWVMRLWLADLSVPLAYDGDALWTLTCVKSVIENGWFLHNESLGAPWALDCHDFPTADSLHFFLMKLMSLAVADPVRVANLYFLLTFPLITLTSLFVLRRFEVAWAPAIVVSVLYAFMPYHIERHLGHLPLAAYYLIPPTVMVLLWIWQDRPVLFRRDGGTTKLKLHLGGTLAIASLLICTLVACAGIYYAVFAWFFLLVTGLYTAVARRRFYPLVTGAALCAVIAAGVAVNLLPSFLYALSHGNNFEVIAREPGQTEAFALKISHLLLPIPKHRLAGFLPYFWHKDSLFGVTLGLVGSVGFVILCARFCFVRRTRPDRPLAIDLLAVLSGCGVLLAGVSSFGFLFSLLVSPWIRCYYRMSVYLAFFALFTVALLLDRLARKAAKTRRTTLAFYGLMGLLLAGGLLDQTAPWWQPVYGLVTKEFRADAEFTRRIEAAVPAGALIFQLPYVPFPEAVLTSGFGAYEHFRPYLHSKKLHWSFGTYRGRAGDWWQQQVSSKPLPEMIETLALAGFSGIYLDRSGYGDAGAGVEAGLSQALGVEPMVSDNGRKTFFQLAAYQARFKEQMTAAEWDAASRRVLQVVACTWRRGFSWPEGSAKDTWRWCEAEGEILLHNTAPVAKRIALEMAFSTGQSDPANLWIESNLFHARLEVFLKPPTAFNKVVNIPPGRHTLRFRCDAARVRAAAPRVMVFRVHNFRLTDLGDASLAGKAPGTSGSAAN